MKLHPLVQRVLDPECPPALRLAAAKGNLPIPRPALLPALVHLRSSEAREEREAASATLSNIGEDLLLEAISDPETDPRVLTYILEERQANETLLLAAISHAAIPVDSLTRAASTAGPEALALLIANQERVIHSPELLESLESNPNLTGPQRGRLAELREMFAETLAAAPAAGEARPGVQRPASGDVVSDAELKGLLAEVGDLPFLMLELDDLLDSKGMIEVDAQADIEADEALHSAWHRLTHMSGAQRLKEALRGGREERAVLIRDGNRIVSSAVLKNPRISDMEVESFAAQRSLHEDVLRQIAGNREWMKSYSVLHNIVRNPKTPGGMAMNFVSRLGTKDLRNLARDRNVPELIRRTARRQYEIRTKPPKTQGKH